MFKTARIQLTAWYLLIIMTISIAFSVAVFDRFHRELNRLEMIPERLERPLYFIPDPLILAEIQQRLAAALIMINALILVCAGGLGYFLAGKTLEPIQEMVEEQNQFISDASHELKTPLTSLKTAFEVYLRSKKATGSKTLIRDSIDEVNKLQRLSEGLLQLVPANHVLVRGKVELQTVVRSALKQLRPQASVKKILLKSSLKPSTVKGDGEQLTQLLVILLDNAIKYSPAASIVWVKLKRANSRAIVTVSDQGMGIAKKDLPHIFDRFYRADKARSKTASGGYGLGLAIAKKIVDAHHGTIKVKSQLNHGTTFQLFFSLTH